MTYGANGPFTLRCKGAATIGIMMVAALGKKRFLSGLGVLPPHLLRSLRHEQLAGLATGRFHLYDAVCTHRSRPSIASEEAANSFFNTITIAILCFLKLPLEFFQSFLLLLNLALHLDAFLCVVSSLREALLHDHAAVLGPRLKTKVPAASLYVTDSSCCIEPPSIGKHEQEVNGLLVFDFSYDK